MTSQREDHDHHQNSQMWTLGDAPSTAINQAEIFNSLMASRYQLPALKDCSSSVLSTLATLPTSSGENVSMDMSDSASMISSISTNSTVGNSQVSEQQQQLPLYQNYGNGPPCGVSGSASTHQSATVIQSTNSHSICNLLPEESSNLLQSAFQAEGLRENCRISIESGLFPNSSPLGVPDNSISFPDTNNLSCYPYSGLECNAYGQFMAPDVDLFVNSANCAVQSSQRAPDLQSISSPHDLHLSSIDTANKSTGFSNLSPVGLSDYSISSVDTNNLSQYSYPGFMWNLKLLAPDRELFTTSSSCAVEYSQPIEHLQLMGSPHGLNLSSMDTVNKDTGLICSTEVLDSRQLESDREIQLVRGNSQSTKCLLIQKQLTKSDVSGIGISLPKHEAEAHLPHVIGKNVIHIQMQDSESEDKTWTMELMFCQTNSQYRLRNTEFIKLHSLLEGDWLKIYKERPPGASYILKTERHLPEYIPSSTEQTNNTTKSLQLILQKKLTMTDLLFGPKSLGCIFLKRETVETQFPHIQEKEGIDLNMHDREANRTWAMKLKFVSHIKGRIYKLQNTREFSKFHALRQGDWLHIYREEPGAGYVLTASKSPLR